MRTLSLLALLLATTPLLAQQEEAPYADRRRVILKTELDSVSYAVGLNLGQQALKDSIALNGDALVAGMRDALDATLAQLTSAQIQEVMMAFQRKLMAKETRDDCVAAIANAAEGKRFLDENGKRTGVTTRRSGLQYRVIREGNGAKPRKRDSVTVHYTGRLIGGKIFDSSVERGEPATFALDSVIPGWTEALQLMPVGSKWEIVVPADLAYGTQKTDDIPRNSTLIFEIELLKIAKR